MKYNYWIEKLQHGSEIWLMAYQFALQENYNELSNILIKLK